MVEVTCAIIREGGKVKIGESPEKAIIREIREELGIRIRVECLLPSVVHHYDHNTIKLIPFVCSIQDGKIILKEHLKYQWVEVDQLEDVDWLEADIRIVEKVKGMNLSEC